MYGDKVKIVWKHFPLEFHPKAGLAHLASMAALEQGKFWPMHDRIYAHQDKMDQETYLQYAKEMGLDVKRFQESIATARGKTQIDTDAAEGKALGVTGTPAFFINGHFLSGAQPFDNFAQLINSELTRLKLPIPAAAHPAGAAPPAAAGG